MENEKTYYEKNKSIILNKLKLKKKTHEEKEKLKQYNRNYYNNVRKNNIDFLNKMKEYNDIHNNKRKELNKEFKVLYGVERLKIIKELKSNSFKVNIQKGKFILEF